MATPSSGLQTTTKHKEGNRHGHLLSSTAHNDKHTCTKSEGHARCPQHPPVFRMAPYREPALPSAALTNMRARARAFGSTGSRVGPSGNLARKGVVTWAVVVTLLGNGEWGCV